MLKTIEHPELGIITLRKHPRARRYTIRLKQRKIVISLPVFGSYKYALEFLDKNKDKLRLKLNEIPETIMEPGNEIELRKKAKETLPSRLDYFAKTHGFSYSTVKITKSKTRWGSCSSKKTINLSYFLILLPEHLADYVILHELCHTVHMNHGSEFWRLLDSVTGDKAKAYSKELRNHRFS